MYETEQQLSVEAHSAQLVSHWIERGGLGTPAGLDARYQKMADSGTYRPDFLFEINQRPVMWAEMKRRYVKVGAYPTLFVSLAKVKYCIELAELTGLRFFVFSHYDDALMGYELHRGEVRGLGMTIGGRTDRPEKNIYSDMEPVLHIPVRRMQQISLEPGRPMPELMAEQTKKKTSKKAAASG